MSETVLGAEGLYKSYGAFAVTKNLSFALERGARHALIGPNGAGKTTFVGLLSGALFPESGRITLMGHDITRIPPAQRVKRGLVRSFQVNNLFRGLTVLENVYLAVSEQRGASGSMMGYGGRRRDILAKSEEVLARLGLADDRHRALKEIPYGHQRLVEIAIALSLEPRVLLLDEPTAGVPNSELGRLFDAIESLPDGLTMMLIEHDMQTVMRFATAISVMVEGTILMSGPPADVMASEEVRVIYLGKMRDGH
jgi:branched-chain amino acid transport system ATP-binding protein